MVEEGSEGKPGRAWGVVRGRGHGGGKYLSWMARESYFGFAMPSKTSSLASLFALICLPVAALAAPLSVFFTSDVQGFLEPRHLMGGARAGGAPALASILAETEGERVLVDTGDFLFLGFANAGTRGKLALELMNQLGYTAATLGNHEFDFGVEALHLRSIQAKFPFLAANLVYQDRYAHPPGVTGSWILKRDGFPPLGLVGLAADLTTLPRSPGLARLRLLPAEKALGRELERLLDQGVEQALVLSHLGRETDQSLARAFPKQVVAIFGGHSPSNRVESKVGGVPVLQPRPAGQEVGRLVLEAKGERWRVPHDVDWIPWATRQGSDPALEAILAEAETEAKPLARFESSLSEPQTRKLVLQAMRRVGRETDPKVEAAVLNPRAVRGRFLRGEVDERDLYRVLPFENHLVTLDVPRKALLAELTSHPEALEADFTPGSRKGRRYIRVVVNSYLAEGGDQIELFAQNSRNRTSLGSTLRDALRSQLIQPDRKAPEVLEPSQNVPPLSAEKSILELVREANRRP